MKEKYFTAENLTSKAREIKKEMECLFKHPKINFTGKSSALLVIDMQKFFQDTDSHAFIPSFETIVPGISNLINTFKENNLPVIFTQHFNTEADASLMAKWWRDLLAKEDEYSLIIDELDTTGHITVKKTQYDAFYNTELENILKKLKVDNLVITGVMTHLCCETTTRSAFVRGFNTFFSIDGTVTYNESFHRNSIMNLSHGFSTPILIENISDKLNA